MAVQLLDAAHTTGTAVGAAPADLGLGAVSLTPSGNLEVVAPRADDRSTVAGLLEQLVQNARRLPAHPRPDQLLLLRRLEEAAEAQAPEADARARVLEASLVDILGPDAQARLRGQLAALVQAFAHVAVSLPVPSVADLPGGPGTPTTAAGAVTRAVSPTRRAAGHVHHRPVPARPSTGRPPRRQRALLHRRSRGGRVGLVAFVLAAALAGSGYVALRGPGAALVESFGSDRQPAAPATTGPAKTPKESGKQAQPVRRQMLARLADRHAGRVTGVALRKTGSCTPGGRCEVKVTVRLRPASTAQPVTWKVGAARLCTRDVAWSPPTAVTAQPGWSTVYAHSTVRVPQGRSLVLMALTSTPARAQSRPVPVTGSSLRC